MLALDKYLMSSYQSVWKAMIFHERAERFATIKCAYVNDRVDASVIKHWIEKLALERIEVKIRRYEERMRELLDQQRLTVREPVRRYNAIPFGLNPDELPSPATRYSQRDFAPSHLWEQVLYEGIMEALGYSKNQQQFLRIAKNLPLSFLNGLVNSNMSPEDERLPLEAALFGVAGLLPFMKELSDKESKSRVRQLRLYWKQIRRIYSHELLNKGEWQFFRLRPENFPTVRLAGAAQIIRKLLRENYVTSIIQTLKKTERTCVETYRDLERLLIVPADKFWSVHYRFGRRASSTVTTLIGESRANDIIINTIIPIALLYARIFKNKEVREKAIALLRCPSPEAHNSVIRTMEEQLIKDKFKIDSGILSQGTIHLHTSYCTPERCGECAIGKILFG